MKSSQGMKLVGSGVLQAPFETRDVYKQIEKHFNTLRQDVDEAKRSVRDGGSGSKGEKGDTGPAGPSGPQGTAGPSDHGVLTGLGDDDHTQYLLKAGGTMTGGLEIDGSADAVQLTVKGHSTQSSALVNVKDGSGNVVTQVSSGGYIGVGGVPQCPMDIYGDIQQPNYRVTVAAISGTNTIVSRFSHGTIASPTYVTGGKSLLALYGVGYTDTGWSAGVGAINMVTTEDFHDGTNGCKITFSATANGAAYRTTMAEFCADGLHMMEGKNIQVGTTNGTSIGTAASQRLGFWGASPIPQPTTSTVGGAVFAAGSGGTNITTTSTFDGWTVAQAIHALRLAGVLA